MNSMNAFGPLDFASFDHRIREVASDCWWVYRQDAVVDDFTDRLSRVVFIGRTRKEVTEWVTRQQEECCSFILSGN